MKVYAITDKGIKRKDNQDSFYIPNYNISREKEKSNNIYILADGMGRT